MSYKGKLTVLTAVVMAACVALSGGVAAFNSVTVEGVDSTGTQTITIDGQDMATGNTVELSMSDVDGNLDMSSATVSTESAGSVSIASQGADSLVIDYTYDGNEEDGMITITVENYSASAGGNADWSATQYDTSSKSTTSGSSSSGSFAYVQTTDTASISGIVTDANINTIEGATVTATHADTNEVYTATTSADGSYSLTGLPSGDYEVEADAFGYEASSHTLTLAQGGSANQDFELASAYTATVEGAVSDEDVSISGATLEFYELDANGDRVSDSPEYTATSDANGNYSVDVEAGEYEVVASHADQSDNVIKSVEVAEGDETSVYTLDFDFAHAGQFIGGDNIVTGLWDKAQNFAQDILDAVGFDLSGNAFLAFSIVVVLFVLFLIWVVVMKVARALGP